MTAETMEESSSSRATFTVHDSVLKKWHYQDIMRAEAKAEEQWHMDKYMDEIKEQQAEASDQIRDAEALGETFGDDRSIRRISASHLRRAVVSIVLFNEDEMVYACSGAAVRHWHRNIRDHHRIFVTTARLAHKFNENRTRDDNLRIEVRTHNATLHGFLGLYDENIAMVTSFSLTCVYTMSTYPHPFGRNKLFAVGRAPSSTVMAAKCATRCSTTEGGLVLGHCKIAKTGLGGPVICFDRGGSGHIAGIITGNGLGTVTFLPIKMLSEWLKRLLLITSTTSHFREYSLPHGVKTVIPSGFVVRSRILQYLGYPLPPPLVFELNGRLAGRFEEHFGQFHYWDGYPFDFPYRYGGNKLIWEQLGKDVTKQISESVVSVASFFAGAIRCFACTGLLIKGPLIEGQLIEGQFILTSLSLLRTDDAEREMPANLIIEVFLPPDQYAGAVLEMYHENYNIAILRLIDNLTTTCPQDIFSAGMSSKIKNKSPVVAIGRTPERADGLLMASMGEVKGKYKAKSKHLTGPHQGLDLDCKDLLLSTCQIKKAGIGGPLLGLDGSFIGMNFYDESRTTPFLPKTEILKVCLRGFERIKRDLVDGPVNLDHNLRQMTRKRKRNQWPVSKPYWYLPGQVDILDQLRGKVLM